MNSVIRCSRIPNCGTKSDYNRAQILYGPNEWGAPLPCLSLGYAPCVIFCEPNQKEVAVAQFIVEGARKDNGLEQHLVIDADDAAQAEQIAGIRGIFVSSVHPINVQGSSAAPSSRPAVSSRRWGSTLSILGGLILIGVMVALIVLVNNGTFDGETYQGKSVKEWLILAVDTDSKTRASAIKALGHMQSARAKQAVRNAALNDSWWEVSAVAMQAFPGLTDEEQVRVLTKLAEEADPDYTGPVTCDAFVFGVERLKGKAAALRPVLQKLRDGVRKKPYPSTDDSVAVELMDQSIKSIQSK